MTTAIELDPYLLPLPEPGSPVVLPHRVFAPHTHQSGRYGESVWPLAPLPAKPSATTATIQWQRCTAAFEDELRLAAWTVINGELRPTFLTERGTRLRSPPRQRTDQGRGDGLVQLGEVAG